MEQRRINALMVLFSIIGGFMGFLLGEYILYKSLYILPNSITMGIYFGQLALFIGFMCLMAEIIKPRLNSINWRNRYLKSSWLFLVPCTLILVFILGTILQFLYGLNFRSAKKINDVVILVDTSESMRNTDPQNKRFQAVSSLMDKMDSDNRISVFVFNNECKEVLGMAPLNADTKQNVMNGLAVYEVPEGMTNIKGSLESAIGQINDSAVYGRSAMVILLSDGGDNYNLSGTFDNTISPYINAGIPVYTVGMKNSDINMLKKISNATGGSYFNVNNVDGLNTTFRNIYRYRDSRILNGRRNGAASSNALYGILRVLFLTIIGVFIGFSVGLVFDNKYIAKGLSIGGICSGLIAGLILETGFLISPSHEILYRLLADLILAFIFTLFTYVIPQKDSENHKDSFRNRTSINSASSFGSGIDRSRRSF